MQNTIVAHAPHGGLWAEGTPTGEVIADYYMSYGNDSAQELANIPSVSCRAIWGTR